MTLGFLGNAPLWAILVATGAAFLLAAELGYRLGTWRQAATSETTRADLGITLGGLLGLLGLLLAFTFGMAGARYEARKSLVIEEANAIGTAWLRTDLVPEPMRSEARAALKAYTQIRLDVARGGSQETVERGIARSEALQGPLWKAAVAAAAAAPGPTSSLFVSSVNEVIDMHGRRIGLSVRNPIPPVIMATLYGVSLLVVVALGFSRGLGGDRNAVATTLLALILAVVLNLILDLDRPAGGYLRVSQQAMQDVRAMMGE
ncbi:MAG TPA: hypothetical protein VFM53_13595 [Anaeromyxobacteraceae bacterium]|jgi:hypothetical protein|nr:hypothetical protein [Anaeromyxobacteraceae bacterium]